MSRPRDWENHNAYMRAYRVRNKEELAAKRREHYLANKERNSQVMKQYYAANHDAVRAMQKLWRKAHREKLNAMKAERKAHVRRATPPWANAFFIKEIYDLAKQRGPAWHVDHVIPLMGETVSGLHVPENLCVVPALDNLRKKNRSSM